MTNTDTPPLLFEDLSPEYQRLIRRPSKPGARVSHPQGDDGATRLGAAGIERADLLRGILAYLQARREDPAFFAANPDIAAEGDRLLAQAIQTVHS